MTTRAAIAIQYGKAVLGHPYELGAKWPVGKMPLPGASVDCSGFVAWAVGMMLTRYPVDMIQTAAGPMPMQEFLARFQGSFNQGSLCRPVPKLLALGPRGAGLFLVMRPKTTRHGHIAISLGYGKTLESRGGVGVCVVGAGENLRRWNSSRCYAAKLDLLHETIPEEV